MFKWIFAAILLLVCVTIFLRWGVLLGFETPVDTNKLFLVKERAIEYYDKEIKKIIDNMNRVLKPEEIEEAEKFITDRCFKDFDEELLGYWGQKASEWLGAPSLPNKRFNFLDVGKKNLYDTLQKRKGKLANASSNYLAKLQNKFRPITEDMEKYWRSILENLPILPETLISLKNYIFERVSKGTDFHLLDSQSNGALTANFNQVFTDIEFSNKRSLQNLQEKLMEIIHGHRREVKRMYLTPKMDADSYVQTVKAQVIQAIAVKAFRASSEPMEKMELSEVLFPMSNDKDSFDKLDKYYSGRLSRELANLQEMLAELLKAQKKKNGLSNTLPLGEGMKTHVFLSHDWGVDGKNHQRIQRIGQALRERGLLVWIDDHRGSAGESGIVLELDGTISDGISQSHCLVLFLTENYVQKIINRKSSDYCYKEFAYACEQLKAERMIPVVMTESLRNRTLWGNQIRFDLPSALYIDFSPLYSEEMLKKEEEELRLFEEYIERLVEKIVVVMKSSPLGSVLPESFQQTFETIQQKRTGKRNYTLLLDNLHSLMILLGTVAFSYLIFSCFFFNF